MNAQALLSRLQKNKRVLLLSLTLLSGVAFSLCSFTARLYSPQSLPSLIDFQTTCVFIAFLIQAGLRAGLRNQYHLGRRLMVKQTEIKIFQYAPWVALFCSGIAFLFTGVRIFPSYATLHAALTLLIGLRIAQGKFSAASFYSVATFLSIVIPCAAIVLVDGPLRQFFLPVESLSFLCLLAFSLRAKPRPLATRAAKQIIVRSMGLQISALAIYLSVFVLGQYVVMLSRSQLEVGVAYADVQMLCGIQSLVFARVILFFEGRLITKGETGQLCTWLVGWSFLFALMVFGAVAWQKPIETAALYAVLALSFLGREPMGILFQFMREQYRLQSILLTLVTSAVLGGAIAFELTGTVALIVMGLFSPAVISFLLTLRSKMDRRFFIQPSQSQATQKGR